MILSCSCEVIFLAFIPFPEGKKVYTKDGVFIGTIKRVYISEFGVHTAVISTNYPEFPEFEVLMTQLKPSYREEQGKREEIYILKDVPIKLQMIINAQKATMLPHPAHEERVPLPTAQQHPPRPTPPPKATPPLPPHQKRVIFTEKAPRPVGPYSQAILAGAFLFVAGQIPIDPSTNTIVKGDIKVQTRIVLNNIAHILAAAGFSLDDVVMVYVYLRNLADFADFNAVYAEYFNRSKPARVTVEVSRLPKDVDIEISVIAYRERA